MRFPALLALLAAPLFAQGLPRNIEMSLAANDSGLWVVNSEDQITRVRKAGASPSDFTTWEPGSKVVNPYADYPVWRGAFHRGRMHFPVATKDAKGRGLLAGFWKQDAAGAGQILSNAATGTLRPVPDQWTGWGAANDTLLGSADSTHVLWQLDGNDSLSALGLARTGALVRLAQCGACLLADSVKARAGDSLRTVQGIARLDTTLLIATTTGLWSGNRQNLSKSSHPSLSQGNVLGVWAGKGGIYAQTDSTVWFLDSVNGTARRIAGDSALVVNHRMAAVAWTGDTAWVLLRTANTGLSGVLRLLNGRVLSLDKGTTPTLLDTEDGLPFSKDVNLSDLVLEPAHEGEPARLWVGSRGEGLAMTTDAGRNWLLVSHKAALRGGLKEVRVIPTRLETGASLIGYSLATGGNVDIEIFNGAMEPVRTVVRGAPRPASLRSEDSVRDRWDGCTDQGRLAAIGLYYVRVKSGNQTAWGKVFQLKGGSSCAR